MQRVSNQGEEELHTSISGSNEGNADPGLPPQKNSSSGFVDPTPQRIVLSAESNQGNVSIT